MLVQVKSELGARWNCTYIRKFSNFRGAKDAMKLAVCDGLSYSIRLSNGNPLAFLNKFYEFLSFQRGFYYDDSIVCEENLLLSLDVDSSGVFFRVEKGNRLIITPHYLYFHLSEENTMKHLKEILDSRL